MSGEWQVLPLGELCEIYQPKTISTADMSEDGLYPVYGANGVIGRYHEFNHEYSELLVTCRGATCGSVNISKPKAWITGNAMVIRPRDNRVVRGFVEYFFRGGGDISHVITGSAQPQITRQSLAPIELAFPPLAEQKRIVAILDETLAGVAAATTNAEKNLANARELFDSIISTIFESSENEWSTGKLGDYCELITKGSSPTWQGIKYVDKPGVLFVTSENVGENEILLDRPKYVEEAFNEKDQKSILKLGDVLTNIVGASIGRTAVFNGTQLANVNQAVCVIRCIPKLLSPAYISYLLNSPYFKKILHDNEVDNARANLSLSFFRNLEIPVPPLAHQETLVAQIRSIESEVTCLKKSYKVKVSALAELKKAILQKAFSGELAARPDPALRDAAE